MVANDRREKAESILRKAAKVNGKPLPDVLWAVPVEDGQTTSISGNTHTADESFEAYPKRKLLQRQNSGPLKKDYRALIVFKSPLLRKYTVILLFIW